MEKTIHDLFIEELQDIYSAEQQIVKALPGLVAAAFSPFLKRAFETHLKETKGQVVRLEKIFRLLGTPKKAKFCKGAKGLIEECVEVVHDFKKSPVRDAALISKAQRIEHYEISAYGTLRTLAEELDYDVVADLFDENLTEEANADKLLTKLAKGGIFSSGINHIAHSFENRTFRFQPTKAVRGFSTTVRKTTTKKRPATKSRTKTLSVKARAKTVSRRRTTTKSRTTRATASKTRR